jgi:hypothetical protein
LSIFICASNLGALEVIEIVSSGQISTIIVISGTGVGSCGTLISICGAVRIDVLFLSFLDIFLYFFFVVILLVTCSPC